MFWNVEHYTPIGRFVRVFDDRELFRYILPQATAVWFGPHGDLCFRFADNWFVCKM